MVVEIFGNFALCESFLKVVVDSRQFAVIEGSNSNKSAFDDAHLKMSSSSSFSFFRPSAASLATLSRRLQAIGYHLNLIKGRRYCTVNDLTTIGKVIVPISFRLLLCLRPLLFLLQHLLLCLLLLHDLDVPLDGIHVGEGLFLRQLPLLQQHLQELYHAHLWRKDWFRWFVISFFSCFHLRKRLPKYERGWFAREMRVCDYFWKEILLQSWAVEGWMRLNRSLCHVLRTNSGPAENFLLAPMWSKKCAVPGHFSFFTLHSANPQI